jgi:integration host factor subunit alpha
LKSMDTAKADTQSPLRAAPHKRSACAVRRAPAISTLTKAELAERLFKQMQLNKRVAKEMAEAFFELICAALENGESVKFSGFGNFQLRDKPQRPGRNLKTGKTMPIAARRVVTFHASQKLKALVEGGTVISSISC